MQHADTSQKSKSQTFDAILCDLSQTFDAILCDLSQGFDVAATYFCPPNLSQKKRRASAVASAPRHVRPMMSRNKKRAMSGAPNMAMHNAMRLIYHTTYVL